MYELTSNQYDTLRYMAVSDREKIYTSVEPDASDPEEIKTRFAQAVQETLDLVGLGLLDGTSPDLVRTAAEVSAKTGRKVRLYLITSLGRKMFDESIKYRVN